MKRIFFILIFVKLLLVSCSPIKIACVGDSITYGSGIKNRDSLSYPKQLQYRLGENYKVQNFGLSGATMLKNGNKPYWLSEEYKNTLEFNPKILILTLGTNDSKPVNWDSFKNEFVADYKAMISSFKKLKSKPKLYIGLPPPVIKDRWGIRKEIVEEKIIDILKKIALEFNIETINFYDALKNNPELFPDNIHPNAQGAKLMAIEVFNTLKK